MRFYMHFVLKLNNVLIIRITIIFYNLNLGFFHMKSSIIRDDFLTVVSANIKSGYASQYEKYETQRNRTTFDFSSLMMYGAWDFSVSDQKTRETAIMLPKDASIPLDSFGKANFLSTGDWIRLNRLYDCWRT
jgi:hypothetical protein